MKYSVIVPVYNEKTVIEKTVDVLLQLDDINELIIVDDGSTDGTAQWLQSIHRQGLVVIYHDENKGYGAALKRGIAAAGNEIIVITDADGTYPHSQIKNLVNAMAYHDMVVGARLGPTAHIPFIRKFPKWCINQLANYLSNTKIPDLNSGLRVMKKSIISRYRNILPNGFSFTTTITLAMLTHGYSVKYIPIEYHKRTGKSKIRPIYDTLNFIQLTIRTILYFNPLKIFAPISFLIFCSAGAVFVYSYMIKGIIFDATVTILFMTSLQILGIGLIADIIDKRLH